YIFGLVGLFFFSSRRRHTRFDCDWSSDVCSSDLLRLNQDYVDFKKPTRIVSMYRSDRWRKLAENMQDERFAFLRPQYCNYILRRSEERRVGKECRSRGSMYH